VRRLKSVEIGYSLRRDLARVDLAQQRAGAAKARQVDVEALAVVMLDQVQHLTLGAADQEVGQERQDRDALAHAGASPSRSATVRAASASPPT
jgi:hypothetical protein